MSDFSPLDLLALSERERSIFLYIARNDVSEIPIIAEAMGCSIADVENVLAALAEQGWLQRLPDRSVTTRLGQVRPRTTLPATLDPQSVPSSRLYSEQQIAILRTAIPMLQFARARLTMFSDHGPDHALRVKSFASQLGYLLNLTAREHHLLAAGAFFHDIGNVVDRERHHIISQETIEKLTTLGKLPFTPKEAEVVGLICRWHRRAYEPERIDQVRGEIVRTGLLASILRVADAMDLDYRRVDYDERFLEIIRFFFPENVPYWTAMDAMGIRIRYASSIQLQIFSQAQLHANIVINALVEDLRKTPLNCHVRTLRVDTIGQDEAGGKTLLVFPFEAHSLVMAAISRRQLQRTGKQVDCLCYPDSSDSALRLWRDTMLEVAQGEYQRLIIIGDLPGGSGLEHRLQTLDVLRASGIGITLLNRHEVTWTQLPQLIEMGIDVVLGNDWAYFWSDYPTSGDIDWGRVAALCTRDIAMAVGSSAVDHEVCQGLLATVIDATRQSVADAAGWLRLAEAILNYIASDDFGFFKAQVAHFSALCAKPCVEGEREGNTIVFRGMPGSVSAANYWVMEYAIVQNGRKMERGIHFETPYAVAAWPNDSGVELLAINHWREERALPIRLLYPSELGPQPIGNESTLHVRLSPAQVRPVLDALIAACNRQGA